MNEQVKIFVNESGVEIPPATTVSEAVRTFHAALGEAMRAGAAYVTDGVGRRIDVTSVVNEGAILRVVKIARGVER